MKIYLEIFVIKDTGMIMLNHHSDIDKAIKNAQSLTNYYSLEYDPDSFKIDEICYKAENNNYKVLIKPLNI